jgi:hypothetical protein
VKTDLKCLKTAASGYDDSFKAYAQSRLKTLTDASKFIHVSKDYNIYGTTKKMMAQRLLTSCKMKNSNKECAIALNIRVMYHPATVEQFSKKLLPQIQLPAGPRDSSVKNILPTVTQPGN